MTAGPAAGLQDHEAERSVLASVLLDNAVLGEIMQTLRAEEFAHPPHAEIFRVMVDLFDAHEPIDLLTLRDALRRKGLLERVGGAEALAQMAQAEASAVHAAHHAAILRDYAVLRDLLRTAHGVAAEAGGGQGRAADVLDRAEQAILAIAQRRDVRQAQSIADLVKQTFDWLDRQGDPGGGLTGISTGYEDLDELTCGMQPSELLILAGRPSMGKTTFAMNIVEHVAVRQRRPVVVFSLEMSAGLLARNLLCIHARVDAHRMRGRFLAESDLPKLTLAGGALSEAPLWIDDTPSLNILELRTKARRIKAQQGVDLVVVDYLQLMGSSGRRDQGREQQVSEISRGLKALARELHVPVIAVSQLNREVENRDRHRPRLSDLRESGAIEQDADVVMLLFREDYYDADKSPGLVMVDIAKQRNGPTGMVKMTFVRNLMRFESHSEARAPEPAPSAEAPF